MKRFWAGLVLLMALLLNPVVASAETEVYNPNPDTTTRPGTAARVSWGCVGHANAPSGAVASGGRGIDYSAFQDCTGGFGTQKVCVQLWSLDYYGNGSSISTMSCGKETVAAHAYRDGFLTCSAIGRGRVKYYVKTKAYAYPYGSPVSRTGQSYSKELC